MEVVVKSNTRETTMHAMTQEDINSLLADGYEVNDGRLPDPKNKPSAIDDTEQPVYK